MRKFYMNFLWMEMFYNEWRFNKYLFEGMRKSHYASSLSMNKLETEINNAG